MDRDELFYLVPYLVALLLLGGIFLYAWQEWTDRAIRDEWEKLFEIQSVGRDITERKRAEESLNS